MARKHWLTFACFTIAIFFGAIFLSAAVLSPVYAQEGQLVEAGNLGLDTVQDTSGLGKSSFGTIVGQIIRVILSVLGVITIVMIIYAGFLWMTAGGSEESIDKAKKTLANGAIGLLIVLSAFAISEFVMSTLGKATGTETGILSSGEDSGGNVGGEGSGGFSSSGTITSGAFQVKTIQPKGDQTYANLQVVVAFTGPVDEASVKNNVKIEDEEGAVPGTYAVAGDTVTFIPSNSCPAPDTSKKCFEEGVEYTVTVTGGKSGVLAATSKKSLSCTSSSCSATFVAGDAVDSDAPEISNIDPINNEKVPVDQIVPIKALLKDDNAIAFGRVELNGQILETVTPTQGKDGLPDEFLMVSKKFSTKGDQLKKEYTVKIVAQDVAGNLAQLSYKIQVAPASCFNKLKDGDEMDLDCSPAGGMCSLCTNAACTSDIQCANGTYCDVVKKVCASAPVVKSVQPQDGAPDTFVTISGTGFGTQVGDVVFLGDPKDDDDDVEADLACVGAWKDTQIVIAVPDGAVDGPIMVKNTAGSKEFTDDQDGLLLKSFQVNDVARPGLCSITPASGQPGKTKITITGNEFLTNASLERKLFIAGYLVDKPAWGEAGPNTVTAFTPPLEAGTVSVGVMVKSIPSNSLEFVVQETAGGAAAATASVSTLTPDKGGVGQYVTIKGSDFGTTPNKVYFVVLDKTGKLTSDQTVADVSLPQQCAKSYWGDKQIVVKVPNIAPGEYGVVVAPFGKTKQSTYKKFVITTDKPGPQLCAVQPSAGPADGKLVITLYGDNFSSQPGGVVFGEKALAPASGAGTQWNKTTASVVVPAGVTTGEVRVASAQADLAADSCKKNPATCSNPMTYTVSDCRLLSNSCAVGTQCCGDGTCQKECAATGGSGAKPVKGVFAWCFSTGDSCDAIKPPRVVEACSTSADAKIIPSPAPSSMWASTEKAGACNNAMIALKFSEPIDPESVDIHGGSDSSIIVEACASEDGGCAEVDDQPILLADLTVSTSVDGKNAGLFVTPKNLKPSTQYRVTLTNAIVGADTGLALLGPATPVAGNTCKPSGKGVYCFYFKTNDKQVCDIASVGVSPSSFTAGTLGAIKNPLSKHNELQQWLPLAYPADTCQILDPESYDWSWTPAKSGDINFEYTSAIDPAATMTPFFAKVPTPVKGVATITATEVKTKKFGTGSLKIDIGPPELTEACEINGPRSPSPSQQWGGDICYDAPIVVEFNQEVALKKTDGSDAPFAVNVLECVGTVAGKECETLNTKTEFKTTVAHYLFEGIRHVYKFETNPVLAKNTHYLVEIPATTKGLGEYGKLMAHKDGCRPSAASCFTFKTSDSDAACAVKDVEVMPFEWSATEYGIQQTYNAAGDLVNQLWHAQAFGSNQCVWLKNKYKWNWSIDDKHEGYAAVDPNPSSDGPQQDDPLANLVGAYWDFSDDQVVAAYKETHDDDPVKIEAETESVTGVGLLNISFPTPRITSFEPSACGGTGVCSNTAMKLTFSTAMRDDTLDAHSLLVACPTKDDAGTCPIDDDALKLAITLFAQPVSTANKVFTLVPQKALQFNTKYRVLLTDGILSTANKKFVEFNYPSSKPKYFSWTFTVSKNQCLVDRVDVSPVAPVAKAQGDKQAFAATAYSAPDSCYPNGQTLSMDLVPWTWASSDVLVAQTTINPAKTPKNVQTFEMVGKGEVIKDEQTATISATIQSKSGKSSWKLSCNAPPVKCPLGTWAGSDHCCHQPPKVSETYPDAGDLDVCRNTLVTIDVTDYVKADTVTAGNVRLGFAADAPAFCTGGEFVDGYCYGKIPYTLTTVNTMNKSKEQHGRIILSLKELLPENADIRLWVRPEGDDDAEKVGLRSMREVPILGTAVDFSTSDGVCELTNVAVYPHEAFFTKLTDQQKYAAYGLSKQGSTLLPISPIANVYAWSWQWFTNNNKVVKFNGATDASLTVAQPAGSNGQTTVTAKATITDDTLLKPSTKGSTIADAGSIEAMLCEVPWIPETVSALKKILDIHNTSFWYCRSSGKSMLTSVTAVEDKLSDLDFTTLHSFRLVDPLSGGAIGFRFEKNLKQYSPREWYLQKNFSGTPEDIVIDGFRAIRVGNTVYIGFANQISPAMQFTNILVISLSEPATADMKAIFDQIVQNLQFVKNINDVGLCYKDAKPTSTQCTTKLDCVGQGSNLGRMFTQKMVTAGDGYVGLRCTPNEYGQYPQLVLNAKTGAVDVSTTKLYPYSDNKTYDPTKSYYTLDALCKTDAPLGQCDKNPDFSCIDDSNCPGTGAKCVNKAAATSCNVQQSIVRRDMLRVVDAAGLTRAIKKAQAFAQAQTGAPKYPIIATDSFIAGLTSSRWPSWSSFMQQLGIVPTVDPINQYAGCGPDSDAGTCWSVKNKKFQCTGPSSVYHYRTIQSGADYALGIPLEQAMAQQSAWQGDGWADAKQKVTNDFCVGVPVVSQAVCGDGALGSGEQCDPPGGAVGGVDKTQCAAYGDFTAVCSQSCKFENISCVNKCGDGVVQAGAEECDEGTKYNGLYNHCGADCKIANPLGYCGNGAVDKNEVCDIGSPSGRVFVLDYLNTGDKKLGVRCIYNGNDVESITFDPTTGVVAHDSIYNTRDGAAAYNPIQPSTIGGICATKETIGLCSGFSQLACISKDNCPNNGACVKPVVGTKYSKNKVDSCNWNCKSTGSYCGDGTIDAASGEECDGNEQGNACTRFCTASCLWQTKAPNPTTNKIEPVCVPNSGAAAAAAFVGCGDGVVSPTTGEECDVGKANNGVQCVAQYGTNNSCQYCTATCKKGFVTGGFCGDGKKNGPEYCDTFDTLAMCPAGTDYSTFKCNTQCSGKDTSVDGACNDCEVETFANHKEVKYGEYKSSIITLRDPTLGWLPIASVSLNDANSDVNGIFIGAPAPQGNVAPPHTIAPIPFHLGSKVGDTYSCLSGGASYKVRTLFHLAQMPYENLLNLKSASDAGLVESGGAFSYAAMTTTVDSVAAMSQVREIEPDGAPGQYRIVLTGATNPDLNIEMFVPKDAQGSKVYPTPNGYVLDTNTGSATGPAFEGCKENGWSVGASDVRTRLVKDSVGVNVSRLKWDAGCSTTGPFVQIEQARPVDSAGKLIGSRTLVTTMKPAHGTSYYGGGYQFTVKSWDNSTAMKIYYYDGAKESSGHMWHLVKEIKPTDPSAQTQPGGGIGAPNYWFPFFFLPETTTIGTETFGTKYAPKEALYAGKYDENANLLVK